MRRNAVPEINDLAKPRAFCLRKLHDSHEVIRATDHNADRDYGADRDHDEGRERIGDLSGSVPFVIRLRLEKDDLFCWSELVAVKVD